MSSVLCLQNNASKLLLAIMESRHDSENAERILFNMRPRELVSIWVYIHNLYNGKPHHYFSNTLFATDD